MTPTGTPLAANGLPLTDARKVIQVSPTGAVLDSSGKPVLTPNGKPLKITDTTKYTVTQSGKKVLGPNGKQISIALNGQAITSVGKPLVAANGTPIFWDGKQKRLEDANGKPIKLDAKGNIIGDKISITVVVTVDIG